jgi:hypothetical protein
MEELRMLVYLRVFLALNSKRRIWQGTEFYAFAALLLFSCNGAFGQGNASDQARNQGQMKAIIENVEANEQLYRDLEVITRRTYRLNKDPDPQRGGTILESESGFRCVLQDNLYYTKSTGKQGLAGGASYESSYTKGYDGEILRQVEKNVTPRRTMAVVKRSFPNVC